MLRKGLTSVELMMATAVVGVALIPALGVMVNTTRQTGFTFAHAVAQSRALTLLDVVGSKGIDTIRECVKRGDSLVSKTDLELVKSSGAIEVVDEQLRFEEVRPGLGTLTVDLKWQSSGSKIVRRTKAFRLVTRADGNWLFSLPLNLVPNRAQTD
jgi:hypothetical protein